MDVYVRRGDSLWLYSQLFNLPIQLIVDSNLTIQQNQLQIGQNIHIPGFVASVYEIKAGDSLWSIATRRNLPVYTLLLTNPNLDPYKLQIGQSMHVPYVSHGN
jgi:g-D-glutamyl-meso-diaminopimelate peptidase